MTYAGIGSRETPPETLSKMVQLGAFLALMNCTLRSGGAPGADKSFEEGCDLQNGPKEIYIPWKGFNGSRSTLYNIPPRAMLIAEKYHPNWKALSQGAQKLMARNVCQILGKNLDTTSNFVVCYTVKGKGLGGTGQALRIAKDYNVPIFDFGACKDIDKSFEDALIFSNIQLAKASPKIQLNVDATLPERRISYPSPL
jgi:hypothetical protein